MPKALESPVMIVSVSPNSPAMPIEFPGPELKLDSGAVLSIPNTEQIIIAVVSPASVTQWRVRRLELISRAYAVWRLKKNNVTVKTYYTSPSESNVSPEVQPWLSITSADTISLTYEQTDGPALTIYGRVFYTAHT